MKKCHIPALSRSVSAVRSAMAMGLLLTLVLPLPAVADEADPDTFGPALSAAAATPVAPSRFAKSGDVQAPPARTLTLSMEEAVGHALAYAPSLAAAEASALASEEGKKAGLGPLLPSLSTSYGYSFSRQRTSASGSTSARTPELGTYTWGVQVSQLLFDGFKTLGSYQKQALQAESDRAALRQSELETAEAVQAAFVSYLCAVENVRSQREATARLRDQLAITKGFHDAGLRPKLDVLQAQVNLSEAERTLVTLENTRDTGLARLNTLLGLSATDSVTYAGVLTEPAFGRTLEECLETAYKTRPDLYVGYKAVEMAVKDRLIAKSGYYPQVEAYYGIPSSGNPPFLPKSGNNGSSSTTWEAGAQLSWEVFQWGTTYFADKQAGWLVTKARANARALLLDAGLDVKEKYLALREAKKRVETASRTVAYAREAYAAALGSYREQVGTNFDVLDASSNLLSAEVDLTAARGDYMTALSSLYVAMGEYRPGLL